MVVDNHEYYQTEGNRFGPEAASGLPGSAATTGEPDATGRAGLGRHVVPDGIRQLF
jgi:hypothetical protein